jgi:hypothetical protein
MKLLISIFMATFFCVDLSAQKVIPQKGSSIVTKAVASGSRKDSGRYEILVALGTAVKLDTFTGKAYLSDYGLYGSPTSKSWRLIKVSRGEFPDESSSTRSKYRIYTQQSYESRLTNFYLLNLETGQTWVTNAAISYWAPFPDAN